MIFEAQVELGTPEVEREAIRNCIEQALYAEEVGFDGRANLGAARGGTEQEMSLCGVDPETSVAQVREALTFIGHCWRNETIEWDSDLLKIHSPPNRPPHTVVPRPIQMPHPPL